MNSQHDERPMPVGPQGVPTLEPQRSKDSTPENDYQLFSDDRATEYDQTHCYKKEKP